MDELFGNLFFIVLVALAAFAQWVTQSREARRRAQQAEERSREMPTTPRREQRRPTRAEPSSQRRVVMVEGPDGPEPRVVDEEEARALRQARLESMREERRESLSDRHLPQSRSAIFGRHIPGESASHDDVFAAPPPRPALAAILPRDPAQLRRVFIQRELLDPPLALRRRRR